MKILFFSDIHGITTNLSYLKKLDYQEHFDNIVVLGDLYYNSMQKEAVTKDNQVLKFLNSYKNRLICLRGNCDNDHDVEISPFTINEDMFTIHDNNLDIHCTHGNKYNRYNHSKINKKGVVIYGHEHYPYIDKKDATVYLNTGSISLPKNDSKPSYTIYHDNKFTIYTVDGEAISTVKIN